MHGLNLTFDAYGSHADVKNNVVHLSVVEDSEIEPAPLTPTEGSAWDLIAGTTRHLWQDAIATPTGMMGEPLFSFPAPLEAGMMTHFSIIAANTDTKVR